MRVVVLAGGLSPERDVSLSSGALIANALLDSGHEVFLLDLFVGYRAPLADFSLIAPESSERLSFTVPTSEPDLLALQRSYPDVRGFVGPQVLDVCSRADKVFLALHGSVGENGQIQAFLDLHGIAYTGSGFAGSLLAMDKSVSKRLVESCGVKTAPWAVDELVAGGLPSTSPVGYPCVVKPLSCGSSVGISFAANDHELAASLRSAASYGQSVLIEQKIVGREFSCGILNGKALPVIEIVPPQGFFDYEAKYQPGMTLEICPARLSEAETFALQEQTVVIHKLLGLGSYSRTDFILGQDGHFYFLESNTLPGMTPTSLFPQEAAAAGIRYQDLCDRILRSGFAGV